MTTATDKPIQPKYAGCLFRPKPETGWATFCDTLGVEWQYEPQRFDIGGASMMAGVL